jgi:hypothetical protein
MSGSNFQISYVCSSAAKRAIFHGLI